MAGTLCFFLYQQGVAGTLCFFLYQQGVAGTLCFFLYQQGVACTLCTSNLNNEVYGLVCHTVQSKPNLETVNKVHASLVP